MPGVLPLSPFPVFADPNNQVVQSNATITSSGSQIYAGFGNKELDLVINIKAAPTGTLPTITFSLQEVDPGDGTTTVGAAISGAALNTATTQVVTFPLTTTGAIKVAWVVTGASASFTQVYATLVSRITPGTIGVSNFPSPQEVIEVAEQQALNGKSSTTDPSSGAQTTNYTNSVAPSSATLSNTAAGYTTLGGLFQFSAPAGATTDYALFAYQVPATATRLIVRSVTVSTYLAGQQSSGSATVLQWAVAVNSSAVSLATGGPNPPIRMPIGAQTAPKSATIGESLSPGVLLYSPDTPFVVSSTLYFHIILRVPIGNATPGQLICGSASVDGYFE